MSVFDYDENEWFEKESWEDHSIRDMLKDKAEEHGTSIIIKRTNFTFYPNLVTNTKKQLARRFSKYINKNDLESIRINKEAHPPVSYPEATNYKKNPYKQKNIFILGVLFIIIIFFIFLIFAVFNYTRNPSINLNLYLIIGIVFCLILMTMYLVKLKIIS